jgi:GTP-binding protein HflX
LLVPYARGDVVARVHDAGRVDAVDHTAEGTVLTASIPAALAGELAQFRVAPASL